MAAAPKRRGDLCPVLKDRNRIRRSVRRLDEPSSPRSGPYWRGGGPGSPRVSVTLAVGGLLPRLGDLPKTRFLALAAGYGVLSLFFVIGGTIRGHLSRQALAHQHFSAVSEWVIVGVTVYISALVILTVIALL